MNTCPHCGRLVGEATRRCPDCGAVIPQSARAPGDGRPGWSAARVACLVVLAVLGVAALLVFYAFSQLAAALGHGLSGLLRPCNK